MFDYSCCIINKKRLCILEDCFRHTDWHEFICFMRCL